MNRKEIFQKLTEHIVFHFVIQGLTFSLSFSGVVYSIIKEKPVSTWLLLAVSAIMIVYLIFTTSVYRRLKK